MPLAARALALCALLAVLGCQKPATEPIKATDEEKVKEELKSLNEQRQKEWGPKR